MDSDSPGPTVAIYSYSPGNGKYPGKYWLARPVRVSYAVNSHPGFLKQVVGLFPVGRLTFEESQLRGADSDLNFDIDLAIKESPDNPVYYVQYAHARIASILRTAVEKGVTQPNPLDTDLSPLTQEAEFSLMRLLAEYPEEITTAAELYEPHRLTRYAQELAREFHVFYDRCPVLKDGVPADVRDARLLLVDATKITLKNVLTLLGISAPEQM